MYLNQRGDTDGSTKISHFYKIKRVLFHLRKSKVPESAAG